MANDGITRLSEEELKEPSPTYHAASSPTLWPRRRKGYTPSVSAAAGYVAHSAAYIKDSPDGNYILLREFDIVTYVIHDAWRINMTGDLLVPYGPTSRDPNTTAGRTVPLLFEDGDIEFSDCAVDVPPAGCDLFTDVSHYMREYGFYSLTQEPSVWGGETPFQDPDNVGRMLSNRTYDLDHIQKYGACQPNSDVYQWGFSYIQIYILITTYAPRLDGRHLDGHCGEAPRGLTALLHLASKMHSELSAAGIDPKSLTDDQLRLEIDRRVNGGMVYFESDAPETKSPADTMATVVPITRKAEASMGCFLWEKTKELRWLILAFIAYFGANIYGIILLPSCFGLYGFVFVKRLKWLLWVYLPCSCILITVTIIMAQIKPV
ncbi:uncharacterized protein B0H64DRAFT_420169 [Chaetomium fimeti]|uniref:Uncharacterized protein n=1 Tax=Chaetomium fimeti TaxID=1854472 RepID=A0AAE0LNS2_9PEZI|nr:hypothetical protein B0H64DRAFT_420169 [Chaetomium fimeti]